MLRLSILASLLAGAADADAPRVTVDFLPVHSLTAMVMAGVGTPDLLLPPGTDPHHAALTPSDAAQLSDADVVIWVGHDLTPWLSDPIATLAPDALILELLETGGWESLPRVSDHDEHAGSDPHGWLDPQIAAVWLTTIAATLSDADPENATTYLTNASESTAQIQDLSDKITRQLLPLTTASYILPHDGYSYFESRFGLTNTGTIALSDANAPGPARIAALRDKVAADGITCVLTDLETDPAWAALLTEGTTARTAQIDGTGAGLTPGPDAYVTIITQMSDAFERCLRP